MFSTRVLFSFCGYFVCAAFAYFPPSSAIEQRHPKRCRHLWTNATLFILFSRTYATLSRTYATLSRTYATLLNNRNPYATLLNLSYLPYLATGKYAVPYLARLTNHKYAQMSGVCGTALEKAAWGIPYALCVASPLPQG